MCAFRGESGTTEDRRFLLAAILARLSLGSHIVITHGTDTILETASYLEADLPVISVYHLHKQIGRVSFGPSPLYHELWVGRGRDRQAGQIEPRSHLQ